jgi:hypothetical protein
VDTSTFHESEDRLELYALGRLPDSEVPCLEEHLLVCGTCREQLDDLAAFALNTRAALLRQPLTPYFPGWFSADWLGSLKPGLALAGTFAVLMMALGIYREGGGARLVPVASLQMKAERGRKVQTVARAREFDLSFADVPAPARLELVNEGGSTVWSGALTGVDGKARAKIALVLSPGRYYARVAAGQVRHEYEFTVVK